ncbi:MAG: DNA polymerase thumb domain-containing protein [Lachnospiraceae bacterium]
MDRIIFHVDVNSAFLSWEAVYRLRVLKQENDIRKEIAVIGGDKEKRHGIVLAKSDSAKSYGVVTGEPLIKAASKCPKLNVYQPRFDWYVECSNRLMNYLGNKSAGLEQFSIDEAWCDMTGMFSNSSEAVEYAKAMASYIREELGFTVNIGISENKLLAKMASGLKKPDMVHTLFREELPDKMWKLKCSKLMYVGKATTDRLSMLGIRTIGELAKMDVNILEAHFKKHGRMIWEYANGIDNSPIETKKQEGKSYGNEMTVPFDVTGYDTAKHIIMSLAETLCARLRKIGVKATSLAVSYTDGDFNRKSRQCILDNPADTVSIITENAMVLLKEMWDGKNPLRLIGVHAVKITDTDYHQYSLFEKPEDIEKQKRLDEAIDSIRKKFGDNSVFRASYMNSNIPHISEGLSRKKTDKS